MPIQLWDKDQVISGVLQDSIEVSILNLQPSEAFQEPSDRILAKLGGHSLFNLTGARNRIFSSVVDGLLV